MNNDLNLDPTWDKMMRLSQGSMIINTNMIPYLLTNILQLIGLIKMDSHLSIESVDFVLELGKKVRNLLQKLIEEQALSMEIVSSNDQDKIVFQYHMLDDSDISVDYQRNGQKKVVQFVILFLGSALFCLIVAPLANIEANHS